MKNIIPIGQVEDVNCVLNTCPVVLCSAIGEGANVRSIIPIDQVEDVNYVLNTCPVVLCSAIGEGAGGIGGGAGMVDITGGA